MKRLAILSTLLVALAACSSMHKNEEATGTTTTTTTNTAMTSPKASGPTDAEIAAIVVTADQVDIDAGKLAKSKSKNKDVKKFAKQMVTDHTSVNKQATDLAKKLNLTPEESDTSKSLKAGGDENMAKLKTMKGAEFDKAYVDHEVEYHEAVLKAIDDTLIPNAKNADLKALLEKVRPAIVAHTEHAKMLQEEMNKASQTTAKAEKSGKKK